MKTGTERSMRKSKPASMISASREALIGFNSVVVTHTRPTIVNTTHVAPTTKKSRCLRIIVARLPCPTFYIT